MTSVSKSLLKSEMLEYLERTGNELIVTDNKKPVLKVIPYREKKSLKDVFAKYQGKARFFTSLTESETEEWGDSA